MLLLLLEYCDVEIMNGKTGRLFWSVKDLKDWYTRIGFILLTLVSGFGSFLLDILNVNTFGNLLFNVLEVLKFLKVLTFKISFYLQTIKQQIK